MRRATRGSTPACRWRRGGEARRCLADLVFDAARVARVCFLKRTRCETAQCRFRIRTATEAAQRLNLSTDALLRERAARERACMFVEQRERRKLVRWGPSRQYWAFEGLAPGAAPPAERSVPPWAIPLTLIVPTAVVFFVIGRLSVRRSLSARRGSV